MIASNVAPFFGAGRGLKPQPEQKSRNDITVAPFFGAGRGLKHQDRARSRRLVPSPRSSERGVD